MRIAPRAPLLVGVAVWIGLAALAVAWPVLWWAAVLGGLVAGVAAGFDARALARRPALGLERQLPERAAQGVPAELVLSLANDAQVPAVVEVFEDLPSDLAAGRTAFGPERVEAEGRVRLRVPVEPRVRGPRRLGPPMALERSGLGLWSRRAEGPDDQRLLVYPDTSAFLRPEALDPRRALATLGVRPARRRGEGSEFDSLREYVPGDDPRHLDWAASARRGKPVVRQYRQERNHTVIVAVDASRLMAGRYEGRSKLDHAVDATLALAYAGLASGDRVGLTLFDREVRGHLAPRRRRPDLGAFVELLRDVHPAIVEPDYGALVRTLATQQRQRALLVVLTDVAFSDPERFTGPLTVLGRRHQVLVVAIRDRVLGLVDDRRGVAQTHGRDDRLTPYRRLVVDDLLREREVALGTLRQRGLQTLDLPPGQITGAVLNRYLALRAQAA